MAKQTITVSLELNVSEEHGAASPHEIAAYLGTLLDQGHAAAPEGYSVLNPVVFLENQPALLDEAERAMGDVLEWASGMGGWDAPCWRSLREIKARIGGYEIEPATLDEGDAEEGPWFTDGDGKPEAAGWYFNRDGVAEGPYDSHDDALLDMEDNA